MLLRGRNLVEELLQRRSIRDFAPEPVPRALIELALEAAAGIPIAGFSYPNGSRDATTLARVRAAGYAFACSSDPDVVLATTPTWNLPRWWPGAGNGKRFSRWFARWVA